MDIDRFSALADALAERLPEPLLAGLTGGIVIEERPRRHPGDPEGVYVLGEYIRDAWLGPRIVLYYGSFQRLFGAEPESVWEQQLWDTIRHELRHHVEDQAGLKDLDVEDQIELERMREESREARRLGRLRRAARRLRGRAR